MNEYIILVNKTINIGLLYIYKCYLFTWFQQQQLTLTKMLYSTLSSAKKITIFISSQIFS